MRSAVLAGLVVLAGCGDGVERGRESDIETPAKTPQIKQPAPSATGSVSATPQLSAAPKVPAEPVVPKLNFDVIGTEPFWSIRVLPDSLYYSSPEMPLGRPALIDTIDTRDGQVRFIGRFDGAPYELSIKSGKCSDGMSDTVYSHSARFVWGDRTLNGCARLK